MELPRQVFAIALLLTIPVSGLRAATPEEKRERLRRLRTEGPRRLAERPLDRAYLDVRALLNQRGSCGDFFGGPAAERVLEELVNKLDEKPIGDVRISISMYGRFTLVQAEGISYRLFATANLNTHGPFYKTKVFPAEPLVPNVGSFRPNTRAARALILLHELAHLIRGRDGRWLIPDDGTDPQLSRQNTSQVESRCGRQIRNLE